MKYFTNADGVSTIEVATVEDLLLFLSAYPGDMPILAHFEGTYQHIKFPVARKICQADAESCEKLCLVFDVNIEG